jgi:adenylate kinase
VDKRYQVFVSSTYADLREERQRVIQALMEMDCIPSGMELFPAADEEQWEFIKRIIDDCDYYLLIIGGRYGSTTPEGISYTEKEYDYAIKKGVKVIALLHANPEEIPMRKSEADPELRGRLKAFRDKVASNRLVRFWNTANELPGLVALSLSKTIKTHPAVGWIRADQASNTQLLSELNELRKRKDELEAEVTRLQEHEAVVIPDLAPLDDKIKVSGKTGYLSENTRWMIEITWKEIFAIVAPHLLTLPSDEALRHKIAVVFCEKTKKDHAMPDFDDEVYQTIKIQFQALGLVNLEYLKNTKGEMRLFWSLTKYGHSQMMALRTIRAKQNDKAT